MKYKIFLVVLYIANCNSIFSNDLVYVKKQMNKAIKSYQAYEFKYSNYFKFFDNTDTSHFYVHQKSKIMLNQLDFGWQIEKFDSQNIVNSYNSKEIVTYYKNQNSYYTQYFKNNINKFTDAKNNLILSTLRYKYNLSGYSLQNFNSNYYLISKEEEYTIVQFNIKSKNRTHYYVNKTTFLVDTFIQWFWQGEQEQYQKIILHEIKHLNKDEIKSLKFESDSLIRILKMKLNGDSISEKNNEVFKNPLKIGDRFDAFYGVDYLLRDSLVIPDKNDSIYVLDFFYTSCAPCAASIPYLNDIDSVYKSRGVKVIGLDPYNNDWRLLGKFIKYHKITYPVFEINYKISQEKFKINSFPTLFIVKNNKIVFIHKGFNKNLFHILSKELDKLL